MIGYLIGYLIVCLICGAISRAISSSRGMEGGFGWGFWLWIIGIIIVAVRPNDKKEVPPVVVQAPAAPTASPVFVDKANVPVSYANEIAASPRREEKRVYTAPEDLYSAGSPILIRDGALLKDGETGAITARLLMKSISSKSIKAVKLKIWPLDTVLTPLGEGVLHEYLDFEAKRDDSFGWEEEISLPDKTTRAFRIELLRVAFTDNSTWVPTEQQWESLPRPVSLDDALDDTELVKQYRLKYGNSSSYIPQKYETLWICSCGAVNAKSEAACHRCGTRQDTLFSFLLESLKAERNERLEQERIARLKREKEERDKREVELQEQKRREEIARLADEKAAKRHRTIKRISIALASIVLLGTAAWFTANKPINYYRANKLYEAGNFKKASVIFTSLGDYKDSSAKAKAASLEQSYNDAVDLFNHGDYENAFYAFSALGDYKDSREQIKAVAYAQASILADTPGKHQEAIKLFTALGQYLDSVERIHSIRIDDLSSKMVGDTVIFGSYEQDNNTSNGKEDIEWIVLAKENNKLLVISKYGLDCQPYNTKESSVSWKNCPLQNWLNKEFINSAFDSDEQSILSKAFVKVDGKQIGSSEDDRIFLLDKAEALQFFSSDEARICIPTPYARAQGCIVDNNGASRWWLRLNNLSVYAPTANPAGSVGGSSKSYTIPVTHDDVAVRPAMWIDVGA